MNDKEVTKIEGERVYVDGVYAGDLAGIETSGVVVVLIAIERVFRSEDEPVCCARPGCGHWRKFHGNKGYGGPHDACDARESGPDGAPDEGPACECPAFVPPMTVEVKP